MENRTKLITLTVLLFVAFLSVSLTSCSMVPKQNASQAKRVLDKSTYQSAEPGDFEGPYADEFANVIKNNPNDFVYSILKDSKITQEGFSLSQNAFKTCINNGGYGAHFADNTFLQGAYVVEAANPSSGFEGGSVTQATMNLTENCLSQSGYTDISHLYYNILVNPERQDLSDYSAQCLVKFGFEAEGYTGQEYLADFASSVTSASGYGLSDTIPGSLMFVTIGDKKMPGIDYLKCQNDPKAALSEK